MIEIDGPSGAGKTRLVTHLCADLRLAGRTIVNAADTERTTNDLGWRTGALMREISHPVDPVEAVFLSCARTAARARLVAGLNDDHTVVLCDRLRLSLDVQTRLAGLAQPVAQSLVDLAVRQLRPDLVVLLDVAHPAHARRLALRGHTAQPVVTFDLIHSHFATALEQLAGPKLRIDTTWLAADEVCQAVAERLPPARVAR